jgi:RNA polymerase sigma-70 factor, ECF subfamily
MTNVPTVVEEPEPGQQGAEGHLEEMRVVEALRNGNESAFVALVNRYHAAMIRVAQLYVQDRTLAEEVAQEAWLGVLQGLDRFRVQSSLKTWIFRILVNRAKTRGKREGRSIPFSALDFADNSDFEHEHFLPIDHPRWPGHWTEFPNSWSHIPEDVIISEETLSRIQEAIENLPGAQREVITLRDVEGWKAAEVCNVLGLSETNQRVLLHRARTRVRQELNEYLHSG